MNPNVLSCMFIVFLSAKQNKTAQDLIISNSAQRLMEKKQKYLHTRYLLPEIRMFQRHTLSSTGIKFCISYSTEPKDYLG